MLEHFVEKMIKNKNREEQRTKVGQIAGVIGLVSNIVLFLGKFSIGFIANSVSIMADAINSLSDMISSILTLVGFKIAAKPADKEHPYGHERFEYISGLAVSFIIMLVGVQFLQSSFNKILDPESITFSVLIFIVLLASIIIKIWQGKMYGKLAKKIDSQTLQASGKDSLNDVFITITVLLSALVEYISGWHIDGFVGFVLALYIIYTGIKMIKDFIDELLGSRPLDYEIQIMEARLANYPSILGYHDLLVHNYGPQSKFASVHIEVDASWDLTDAHQVIDMIEKDFKENLEVELVCHLDPVAIHDDQYLKINQELNNILADLNQGLKMHDLRIKNHNVLQFDLVIPEGITENENQLVEDIRQLVMKRIGNYHLDVRLDHNYLL
ncbi:cation diffusion facilitator family transporter [Tetragenococcus halophilus]|uniref:cation diffusion facilitator family transporter n=1 Tax=Tetragenococcus halophilus TaxID=51669 RepID=UPI000B929B53|nr:cation diffusion facilitator family transporter [Tetragenococcus halophilus]RQD32751.1 cation transporter [Tetragenococcus halophilus subsp. halophilus DSM 20339]GBD58456.1 putative cation efflux protein [Tetragenococcus halophilus subsp. halophilus]GMA43379.1 cation transporter [Tetragenococcus halophilus subsp. halophilus DSM 20339]GMG62931.1 cation diffusion facilitator family transporter [Tetragenococcus halophilus]GMG66033.1 cation diffusion facilitator family transporter [Tetragenococ